MSEYSKQGIIDDQEDIRIINLTQEVASLKAWVEQLGKSEALYAERVIQSTMDITQLQDQFDNISELMTGLEQRFEIHVKWNKVELAATADNTNWLEELKDKADWIPVLQEKVKRIEECEDLRDKQMKVLQKVINKQIKFIENHVN